MADKKSFAILFLLFTILTSIFAENKFYLYDNAEIIPDEYVSVFQEVVEPLLQFGEIAFVSNPFDNTLDCSIFDKAVQLSEEIFEQDSNAVILFDLNSNLISMVTNGQLAKYVDDDQAYKIVSDVCDELAQQEQSYYYQYPVLCFEKMMKRIIRCLTPNKSVQEVGQNNNRIYIYDEAKLLSDDEQELLKQDMLPLTEYGNVSFVTHPVDNSYSGEANAQAGRISQELFGDSSQTILFIDMYNRRIEIWSYGELYKHINITRANIITTNTYKYATNEDYFTCASQCFKQMCNVMDGENVSTPLKYVSNFLFSFGIVLLIMFLYIYFSRKHFVFKNNVKAIEEENSSKQNKIIVNSCKMTKQRKTVHSSSSGGGVGHGGGGGGGGGGGHSF